MQIGMIGLGRMGANMVRRLMRDGHECVVYDHATAAIEAMAAEGAIPAHSLAEMNTKLQVVTRIFQRGKYHVFQILS